MKLYDIGYNYGTDKVDHGYLSVYEKHMEKYKDSENLNILELGVLGGCSMQMWRAYFPKARVMGADIQSEGNNIRGELVETSFFTNDSNCRFYLCDQSDKDQLTRMCESIVKETGRGIDIFIDDASHFQPDMMLTLGVIFPYMEEGGVFVIEDLCTEENLLAGHRWWGSDQNPTIDSCVEKTMIRYLDTGTMTSPYLSEEMLMYLNDNITSCDFYKALVPPISGTSSLVVLTK